MKLTTPRLILRDLEKNDLGDLVEGANNLNVSRYLLVVPFPYTRKDGQWFISHCHEKAKEKPCESYELGIELKPERRLIGIIGLTKVDRFQGTAEIGYWLGESYQGKGYMTEATCAVLDFAFNKLKLRRINVAAFVENSASNALIRKLGFSYEGTRKQIVRAKSTGKVHDEHVYGLLREDWFRHRKSRS